MRIAYIATGAAGMICGTCIHDNTLAAALLQLGHEVALVPTYTPIRTDEENVSMERVFYGGLNVYLEEKFRFFRRPHSWLDTFLNQPRFLNWLSKFSSATSARDLGTLTVSMLRGEDGHQSRELETLCDWLTNEYQPDIVHLNHSMLLGTARQIKKRLQVPVICGVQGEDLFLDDLVEPYQAQAKQIMVERASDVDSFVATSEYYADFMAGYLRVDRSKMQVVNLGIHLDGYKDSRQLPDGQTPVIGYLARLCPEKGLHLLIEACLRLWEEYGSDHFKLRVAGYLGKKDEDYFDNLRQRVESLGMSDRVDYVGEVDHAGKVEFLAGLDLFSVPTVYRESKGLSILEAMASAVPVVQPRHGLFPEIIEQTGGGILVEPDSLDSLVKGIDELLAKPDLRRQLGGQGRAIIHDRFSDKKMAESLLRVYKQCLA